MNLATLSLATQQFILRRPRMARSCRLVGVVLAQRHEERTAARSANGTRYLLGVREEYLERYLDIASQRHGSFDGYLEKAIGVDDALRDALIARFVA